MNKNEKIISLNVWGIFGLVLIGSGIGHFSIFNFLSAETTIGLIEFLIGFIIAFKNIK